MVVAVQAVLRRPAAGPPVLAIHEEQIGPAVGVEVELSQMAQSLPDPVDRYWMVVYALCGEQLNQLSRWRFIPFVSLLQRAFQIGDADMELAATDAAGFPSSLPRPK